MQKRLGREDRIFCRIVGGEPNASDLADQMNEDAFRRPCALDWDPTESFARIDGHWKITRLLHTYQWEITAQVFAAENRVKR